MKTNAPDAKVLYQYPKGNFKFPLIPDHDRLNRKKEAEHRGGAAEQKRTGRQEQTETRRKVAPVSVENKPRKIQPSNIPFRPTETPSPIYGLEQRPEKKEPKEQDKVEFELKSKEPTPVKLDREPYDVPAIYRKKEKEILSEVAASSQSSVLSEDVAEPDNSWVSTTEPDLGTNLHSETAELEHDRYNDSSENRLHAFEGKAVSTNPEKKVEEELETGRPRKKHLPFNVMMTKQDKDVWKQSGGLVKKNRLEHETNKRQEEALAMKSKDDDAKEAPYYAFPSINLLTPPAYAQSDREWLNNQSQLLNDTLKNFNVRAKVVNVTQGPAVTRFEVQPEPGVKVNKITNLSDDIKLSLAAQDIRMEAPIPGKHTIGIEIPNRKSKPVFLREVLESEAFRKNTSPLAVALGLDISGEPIVTDLNKMPHGLIAGATGSGKSVCINTMLISLLYKATPQELKLLLIDPKVVELAPYNNIPHLVSPVITDVKAATAALKWAVEEMERRYELFAHTGVRDISRFNEMAEKSGQYADKLPYIVVIIDELADLMMMSPADVEEAISRIAQKARACGIHLIVATQRPSVDVITGLIKANIPTRIAFSVSSQVDSRTIIDSGGAEKLLGKGDMLFAENGSSKSVRLQGTYVSDGEIDQVVRHVKNEQAPNYLFAQEELLNKAQVSEETDELFYEACEFAVNQNGASASSLQRRFHVGYNRAARLIEVMERQGILSESRGSKPRDVLISEEELEYILETNGEN
ncbi:DNA translocase FtsK [Bacillus sp. CECT 9360]|uniref:DNA translocase FtsK n=1 Tax=Bacillus sp. CECT 9360 TaxID=2845821 RepID=UPI001E41E4BA|nr:DNA translocase FtsK [Bacillus sp. CECT 9360]